MRLRSVATDRRKTIRSKGTAALRIDCSITGSCPFPKEGAPTRRFRVGARCLVGEFFDFATVQTGSVGRQLCFDQLHEEVEAEDVDHSHCEDRGV